MLQAEDPDAAVKEAGKLGRAGTPFLLVTDLGMPTSGGSKRRPDSLTPPRQLISSVRAGGTS